MSRIKIWNRAPDNSRLHVRVEGGTGTAQGHLTISDGSSANLPDAVLRRGEPPLPLRTPNLYSLNLSLRFAASSTMTVRAHVEKPDGTHFGQDYEEPVTGAAGDVKTVVIGVVTLQR